MKKFQNLTAVSSQTGFWKSHSSTKPLSLFNLNLLYLTYIWGPGSPSALCMYDEGIREDSTWQSQCSSDYFKWEVCLPCIENKWHWEAWAHAQTQASSFISNTEKKVTFQRLTVPWTNSLCMVLMWNLQRETKIKCKRSFTFLITLCWWGGLVSGSSQPTVFPPLRWLEVTCTPISELSISGSHDIVTQKGTGCKRLFLNYKIAQKCTGINFPHVLILCATIWWHFQQQTSSSILLLQINIWDTNPIGIKSQAFKQILFFFSSLLISRIFQLAAVNKIHL